MTHPISVKNQVRIALASAVAGISLATVVFASLGFGGAPVAAVTAAAAAAALPPPPITVSNAGTWVNGQFFVVNLKFQPGDGRFDNWDIGSETFTFQYDQTKATGPHTQATNGAVHTAAWPWYSTSKNAKSHLITVTFTARCPYSAVHGVTGAQLVTSIHPQTIGTDGVGIGIVVGNSSSVAGAALQPIQITLLPSPIVEQ